MPASHDVLVGWGRTPPSAASVEHPATEAELERSLDDVPPRGVVARGLGRSYGDAAQNAGGKVVDTTGVHRVDIDAEHDTVTAAAGVSLDTLLRVLVPRGWFVPVTPGTRYVTVGGAVAADIHGKNHHHAGSWCQHVSSLRLQLPSGEVTTIGPDRDAELFWATAGGMGLTGLVLDATFRCPPIETSRLVVDTDRTADLDATLAAMTAADAVHDYSVAWIDVMATGARLGRSVLTSGRFARADELDATARRDPLAYRPAVLPPVPPLVPDGLLNRLSLRAFCEFWFRKAPTRRRDEMQTIAQFFHPLDAVTNWNRGYGPRGFLQWQIVVPLDATATLRRIIERCSAARCPSAVTVLKRFGPANPGPLSFPMSGWTLTLDIPAGVAGLGPLLDELDRQVADVGGRVYLAKDSRLAPELLPAMYPRLDEWRAVCRRADPEGVLSSDLTRRLSLT